MSKSIERRLKLQSAYPSGTPCKAPNLDSKPLQERTGTLVYPHRVKALLLAYSRGLGISNAFLKTCLIDFYHDREK